MKPLILISLLALSGITGDLNGDGKVDLADYAIFQRAMEPPAPSPTPSPSPLNPPTETASSLVPIGDWDAVPGQPDGRVGVPAFAKPGIWGVVFVSAGRPEIVTEPTPNPATGVVEYWHEFPAGDVTATVIGLDGGRRELPALRIGPGPGIPRVIRGGKLKATDAAIVGSGKVWLDGVTIEGDYQSKNHPVGGNVTELYLTNCTIRGTFRAQGWTTNCVLMCGCIVEDVREDVGQNCRLFIRNTVRRVDPGINPATGLPREHADVWQLWGPSGGNYICYANSIEATSYQGAFCRWTGTGADGIAIVGNTITMSAPTIGSGNGLQGRIKHLVFTGNVLTGFTGYFGNGSDLWVGSDSAGGFGWSHVLFKGNVLGTVKFWPTAGFSDCVFTSNLWGGMPPRDGIPG